LYCHVLAIRYSHEIPGSPPLLTLVSTEDLVTGLTRCTKFFQHLPYNFFCWGEGHGNGAMKTVVVTLLCQLAQLWLQVPRVLRFWDHLQNAYSCHILWGMTNKYVDRTEVDVLWGYWCYILESALFIK